MSAIKTRSIFDFLSDLTHKKTPWGELSESDRKAFSPYMVGKILSMHPDLLEFVNDIQKYTIGLLRHKDVYNLYLNFLPKMKLPYKKYIKSKNEGKYNQELVDLICKHFWVASRHATDYIDILGKEGCIEIIKMYGADDKKIKNYFKK